MQSLELFNVQTLCFVITFSASCLHLEFVHLMSVTRLTRSVFILLPASWIFLATDNSYLIFGIGDLALLAVIVLCKAEHMISL